MKKMLLLIVIVLGVVSANAIVVSSRQFNTTNGLPNNNIRSLAQDAKGFIWMGSPNGLIFKQQFGISPKKYQQGNRPDAETAKL